MSSAKTEREQAAKLPSGDVVGILLQQHARIRDLFGEVKTARGDQKKQVFDELRAVLAVHETAEEMIVRPAAMKAAGEAEAEARNHEEEEANKVLAELETMDIGSAEFDALLAEFEQSVIDHAEHEEREEFPAILRGCDEDQLKSLGSRLVAVEKMAPTHPHPTAAGSPTAQWTTGPFAALLDRAKDAINSAKPGN
ncbi:hemerythrin domain-containing protein [Actinacidiphila soli]|jgi:succinate dehydrogenase flavin-adding protein (antitoxin of CptAB toxin-antitoxin module)|uniref:hemerythrin domain-containing protein n=1 Tax=Actinacidiphila soli TaxID=2487275 RepID=UPI000FCBAF63|nr:hemerythrin domain-containing protein [Actinacidiphila soli]